MGLTSKIASSKLSSQKHFTCEGNPERNTRMKKIKKVKKLGGQKENENKKELCGCGFLSL